MEQRWIVFWIMRGIIFCRDKGLYHGIATFLSGDSNAGTTASISTKGSVNWFCSFLDR